MGDGGARIGVYAFGNCTSLMGVYFKGDAPGVGADVFYGDKQPSELRGFNPFGRHQH